VKHIKGKSWKAKQKRERQSPSGT